MRQFLLMRELPFVFAVSLAAIIIALLSGLPLAALFFAGAALWCAALWLVIARA